LNLRAEYSAFDRQTGRPLCVGNGEVARRVGAQGMEEVSCPGPERCAFAGQQGCKLYGRLNLFVEGQGDELGSFIFRTTGYNSVRTLAARLKYLEAVSGGHTRYLPLTLRLRAKSTTQSYRTPVYYVDLTLREETNLTEAIRQAHEAAQRDQEAGLAIDNMEQAARDLLRNGQFEDIDEEVPMLLEEFYPEANTDEMVNGNAGAGTTTLLNAPQSQATRTPQKPQPRRSPLTNKLGQGTPPSPG
ncbi:recombination directionality factor, partial [Aeromonas veronii]